MLKLFKYELKKQSFSKLMILAIAVLFEIAFLIGLVIDNTKMIGLTGGLSMVFTFIALVFMAFEAVITYNNDLKTKTSYMLFLTPTTPYQIVGAKLLSTIVQVVIAGFAFLGVYIIDFLVLVAKYDYVKEVKELIAQFLDGMFGIQIDYISIVSVLCMILASWISTIAIAFLAITLSTTFLANKRFKIVVSAAIFIIILIIETKVMNVILDLSSLAIYEISRYNFTTAIVSVVFMIISYFATSWMLDKKISV